MSKPESPAPADHVVDRLLGYEEGTTFETKRVGPGGIKRALETLVAFANKEGGTLVLGLEDPLRKEGRDRVYGIDHKAEAVDDLRRRIAHDVTPPFAPPYVEVPSDAPLRCTLRDGTIGTAVMFHVNKSSAVHSIVDDGTFVRMGKSNRQISAEEITHLSMQRGAVSMVSGLVKAPFDLLETQHWREYAGKRGLTRRIADAMRHVGLAREDDAGKLRPTRAAVLLFAEEPSGLLDSKCAVRVFHYRGDKIERSTQTNLLKPPKTIGGPLIVQIRATLEAVLGELASGVQMGPLGFEIAQKYPVRVIREAITNAIIHRDYSLNADIIVHIFASHISVYSPGFLPGGVTVANLGIIGSRPRNRAIVDHLREFPTPPNLDAGEGVRMMNETMTRADLYPPIYLTAPEVPPPAEAVCVLMFNQSRPSIWNQVDQFLQKHGDIGNAEVRHLLNTDDPVRASKLLKSWVKYKLLVVANPTVSAKQLRRYRRPGAQTEVSLFTQASGKDAGKKRKG